MGRIALRARAYHGTPVAERSSRRPPQTKVASKMGNVALGVVSQKILPELRNEANCTLSFRCAHSGSQSMTEHLPVTDAEKIADALRAAPNFITQGATIADYPASKGGEFRVLRKGMWTLNVTSWRHERPTRPILRARA